MRLFQQDGKCLSLVIFAQQNVHRRATFSQKTPSKSTQLHPSLYQGGKELESKKGPRNTAGVAGNCARYNETEQV
jgi:hypothetical protein